MRLLSYLKHLLIATFAWLTIRLKSLYYLFQHKELYRNASYYPEYSERARSSRQILLDQFRTILKWGYPNNFYFSYGFDVKSRKEQDEYVQFRYFLNKILSLNQGTNINCCCILRDKILFNIFANGIGIETPKNVWYSTDGHLFDYSSRKELFFSDLTKNDLCLFCKLIDGECGRGIFKMEVKGGNIYVNEEDCSVEEAYNMLIRGRYLAQSMVKQHPQLESLHSQSINSLRLVTVRSLKDSVIRVWPSILRIGTGSSIVDNTSQGGLCVGIDFKTNHLKKWGFYKPQFGRKTDRHPDSDVVFAEFEIPFLKEVQEKAIYFHSMLPGVQSVGWDIAIGDNGPIFIEGNDNWEINGPQICNGGLMKLFKEQMYC